MTVSKLELQKRYEEVVASDKERGIDGDNKPLFLYREITDMDLSVRAINILKYSLNIEYLDDLRIYDPEDLRIRGCGKKTHQEIKQEVESWGAVWYSSLRFPSKFDDQLAVGSIMPKRNDKDQIEKKLLASKKQFKRRSPHFFLAAKDTDLEIEERINEKLGERFRNNADFVLTPIKDLPQKYSNLDSVSKKMNGKEGLDFIADVILSSEEQLKAKGLTSKDIIEINNELRPFHFQINMKELIRKNIELEDQQTAEQKENLRLESKRNDLMKKYGL